MKKTPWKIGVVLAALITLVALSTVVVAAETYSGTCGDNLTWSLATETGVLSIEGMGAMNDYSSYYPPTPWYSYRSSIKTVDIANGMTSIGRYVFYYCSSLTSIEIPSSVTNIGEYAFKSCSSLTSITIPDVVTSIGDCAFIYCMNLTSVTIPSSVTSIGYRTFTVSI